MRNYLAWRHALDARGIANPQAWLTAAIGLFHH